MNVDAFASLVGTRPSHPQDAHPSCCDVRVCLTLNRSVCRPNLHVRPTLPSGTAEGRAWMSSAHATYPGCASGVRQHGLHGLVRASIINYDEPI